MTHEYAFDVTLAATIRVKAATLEEAVIIVRESQGVDGMTYNHGTAHLGEWSTIGTPNLFEVDDVNVEEFDLAPPTPLRRLRAALLRLVAACTERRSR
ncbi:hypothetical protein ABT300_18860 [Streptomyces sp. NPDC001027]|uniref:hypothetical protein n=1 Tax=Streptomyces sp. NPDC001027 TaxID=3154771 RepID=UPI00332EFA62